MIDLEKLKNDLEEVARAASQGNLTRQELVLMRLDLEWALERCARALLRRNHPEEPKVRNERGYR